MPNSRSTSRRLTRRCVSRESTGSLSLDSAQSILALAGEIDRQAQLIGYLNAFLLYTAAALVTMPFLVFVTVRVARPPR